MHLRAVLPHLNQLLNYLRLLASLDATAACAVHQAAESS
jgi:hypothetical protein